MWPFLCFLPIVSSRIAYEKANKKEWDDSLAFSPLAARQSHAPPRGSAGDFHAVGEVRKRAWRVGLLLADDREEDVVLLNLGFAKARFLNPLRIVPNRAKKPSPICRDWQVV